VLGTHPASKDEKAQQKYLAKVGLNFLEKQAHPIWKTAELVAIKGVEHKRFDRQGNVVETWREYDTAVLRQLIEKCLPSINKTEITGKDGRPLVPWTVVAPDPDADEEVK
jgi:hypothetical protein